MVAPLVRETIGDSGMMMANELHEARIDGLEAGASDPVSHRRFTRSFTNFGDT